MNFRILGPLEVRDGDRLLALGGSKQRALLALLLLRAGEVVSTDRLVEDLWGDSGLSEGSKALHVAVSRLRSALEPDRPAGAEGGVLVTRPPGYELRIAREQLDLFRFEDLLAAGSAALAAGDAARASAELREALALWRGEPLADLAYESFAQTELARLDELHATAIEERITADIELGRGPELITELQALVKAWPLRERPRAQLMRVLYRAGRQAEALAVYRDARRALVDQLGIEPSRELQELESAILRQDLALDSPGPRAAVPEPSRSPFVGREAELAQAEAAINEVFGGRGRLVLLAGEPGIGKSRLAEEVSARARSRDARVLVGRCWEVGGAPAYWPWVQALRPYIAERDRRDLRDELGAGGGEMATLFPGLRAQFPDLPDPSALDPEAARFRLFDALVSFIARAAAKRPIVLVLDDLHAADEPSLLLLRFATQALATSRVLIVGAYRDVDPVLGGPLASTLAELATEPAARRMELGGLAERDVAEYVRQTTGAAADDATVTAIHFRTEGNALFVDQVTRMLAADGGLRQGATGGEGLPQSVRDVIGQSLQRLSPACRQALTRASVLGREFALDALAGMTGSTPGAVLELLDEALEARTVGEAPGGPGRLRFSHALVRDVLYDELTPGRRLRLHAQAGGAIEALCVGNEAPHLAELAHHFVEAAPAGDSLRAVDYARRAGDHAASLLAYEEAARLYSMAIGVLAPARENDGARCELLLSLGDAEARGGGFGTAQETFVRAAAVASRIGAAEQLGRAALGYGGRHVWFRAGKDQRLIRLLDDALAAQPSRDSGMRAMLLARLAGALRDRPVPDRRAALTAEAVEIARRVGDPATLAYAIEGTYASISWPRDADRWLAMARELNQIARQLGDSERAFAGHLHAFGALMVQGDVSGADVEFDALTDVAHELRQPLQLWGLAMAGVMRALQVGDFDRASELVERESGLGSGGRTGISDDATFQYVSHFHEWALGREQGALTEVRDSLERYVSEYPDQFIFRCMLTSLYSEIGEVNRARSELERLAADDFQGLEVGTEWFFGASLLAEVCERLHEPAHAPRLYAALAPYADYVVITHPEINLGSAARYLGLLASASDRLDDAVVHYERALEANARMALRPWLARTQADLARTLLARDGPGDVERSGELSDTASATFAALGMREPAERLRAATAGARTHSPPRRGRGGGAAKRAPPPLLSRRAVSRS